MKMLIRTEVKEFFFDSHCHLDFIYKKYSCGGIDSWLKSEPGIMHEKFIGCIPNFIEPNLFVENLDPAQYDMDWILQQLQSKYVLGASYGCHPHYGDAFDDRILEKLQYLVENRRMSKLLAIGECGLDYMKRVECYTAQLALARKKDVPLVIHCRSGPRGPGDAEKMCLSAMEEAGLSRFHNIHRHCFTENWDTAQKWMESYDNVYFGT
ncbi:hydrolase, TatD family [Oesophagostomum dentatum]|uniref:Hydrolase, TatD family n=1 Tax=Oesophagostomum dentatum TaxID=61180 RepID=A0A0B1SR61_OESDE|nr:hydrolase, TatD family [Oesophagostomum dentatum]